MVKYIKCPRCELNYIDSEKQEYCDVCLAELAGNKLQFADLDDDDYDELDAELEEGELCPVCGVNRVRPGETMCDSCLSRQEFDEEEEVDIDKDEEWKNYLDDDDTDLTVDDNELDEELKAELDDDGEEEDDLYHGEDDDDDFDEDLESLDSLEDDDYDDDDDDDEDDDDGF